MSNKLATYVAELEFQPSKAMLRARANLQAKVGTNPLVDPRRLNLVQLQNYAQVSDTMFRGWLDKPGFREWLTDDTSWKSRLIYLTEIALDAVEQVLTDELAPAVSRISAAKLVLEAANRMPSRNKVIEYADQEIANKSADELRALIRRNQEYLSGISTDTAEGSAVVEDGQTEES